jgi:integrase
VVTSRPLLTDELGAQRAKAARATRSGLPRAVGWTSPANELRSSLLGTRRQARGISPAPMFHDLRHASAALAVMQGAHPKAIQVRLGHASITTTLNTYGHLFPSFDVELAERLGEARAARLRHAGGSAVVPIEAAKR